MTIESKPPNGWTRYEYAVLHKLEELEDFNKEMRSFITEVTGVLQLHCDHPTRITRLELRQAETEKKSALLWWKVGMLSGLAGALLAGIFHLLLSTTGLNLLGG